MFVGFTYNLLYEYVWIYSSKGKFSLENLNFFVCANI
jgi:hypothetical protein